MDPSVLQPRINRYIEHEKDLAAYLEDLHRRSISAVALDLEGDQGTIRYAYSISIIQCFDGSETAVIDVLSLGNNPALRALRAFLIDPAIVKIMFSCANDVFMTQNVLGCTIAPVRDIAVGQKLLKLPINLSEYLKIDKKVKDSFQRANWLKRPIKPDLLNYAINDVMDLFTIECEIAARLREANKYETYLKESAALTRKNYVIDHLQHYKAKFPGYKNLSPEKRGKAAVAWVFRELMGKHFDCPVGYILSKHALAAAIADHENMPASLERELNRGRSTGKRVTKTLVEKYFNEALRISGNRP